MSDAVATSRRPRAKLPIALVRAGARDRKARQRARDAEAGRPDVASIDRALGDALRKFLSASSDSMSRPLTARELLEETRRQLRAVQVRRVKAGKVGVIFDPEKVVVAMRTRLKIPA
ncbi:hypothetical protein [Methylobacterium sp. WL7]|uniref:hypothetical protein n=1 Tax=Methylobacterium sp. WL7 TaxID=2603900 RepID=UPI0011CCA650|nr:hypothetical protein [Methylobacterium sp. WL7]TXN47410.1 hypothetical protein FV233_05120 [Methylobacterium sp. WL7]